MNSYTICCTSEQAKKALELGAPIITCENKRKNTLDIVIPTAEQMIGWLEEQDGIISVEIRKYSKWCYQIAIYDASYDISRMFKTRKEATLAAIDVALEYLNNKLIK